VRTAEDFAEVRAARDEKRRSVLHDR
jgi:hypothetical protein